MMENQVLELKEGRRDWIDVAKFMAIVAVIIDHTNGVLYQNQSIAKFSYYSVSLFILMMGITTYWSLERVDGSYVRKIMIKCWGIFRPYLVATFIYNVFAYRSFDFGIFINNLIHFNASGPLYYVFLYIQLVVVSPIIFMIFATAKRHEYSKWIEIIGLMVVLVICSFTTNYTNILSIYGGGGKLLGGNYLFLVYAGMWIAKYYKSLDINKHMAIIIFAFCVFAVVSWWQFMVRKGNILDTYIPFGGGFNPPSVTFCVYAIIMALTIYMCGIVVSVLNILWIEKLFGIMSYLGKHTLYIFLYHRFFLDYIINYVVVSYNFNIENIWLKRLLYVAIMIIGSLILEVIFNEIGRWLNKSYRTK